MTNGTMNCPVCNKPTSGRFCEHCGFELHVLPKGVSEEVITYENERVENYKKAWEKFQKINQLQDQLSKSEANVSSLDAQLEQARENVHWDGIVRIFLKNSSGEIIAMRYLPVFKGLNIYGTKPNNRPNCQTHAIGILKTPIQDEHFSVEKSVKGQLVLQPINGDLTCDGKNIPKMGQAVEIHHQITIGKTIEIRISKI